MNCVILAAGIGNRLKPLTNTKPKCLVEIGGKSLLSWQLSVLNDAGINNINIVTGHKYKKIINLKDNRINKVFINNNYLKNNMVKSLLVSKELFSSPLLISYSDIIYSSKIITEILKYKGTNSIIVDIGWFKLWSKRFINPLDDAETLKFDKNFNLIDIGKKTKIIKEIMAQYIGLIHFNKDTLNFIADLDLKKMIDDNLYMTDLLRILLTYKIEIKIIPVQRGWLEVDTLEDLILYQNELKKNIELDIFSIFS